MDTKISLDLAVTAKMRWEFSQSFWRLAWIQMTVFAETNHYHSFMDP